MSQENIGSFIVDEAAAPEQAEQAVTPTPATPPEKVEPAKDQFSVKFAALSRKEKEVKQREAAIAKRMAEVEARAKEYEEKSKSERSLEQEIKENPLKFLREKYGYDFEQLAAMQLNDENPTYDMKLERRTKEIEEKALSRIEQLEKALKEKEEREVKEQYERSVSAYKAEIKAEVEANADAYELIQANDAYDLVFQVAEQHYNNTAEYEEGTAEYDEAGNVVKPGIIVKPGKILSTKEAAEAVEMHLEERAKEILKLKKFNKASTNKEPVKKEAAPTLSNTLASEVPQNGRRPLSNEEELAEAAKLIRWS
jgi:hypothetical protein